MGKQDATGYWIERSESVAGSAAVQPGRDKDSKWDDWKMRMLQRWTLARLDRPRFGRALDLGCGRGDWTALLGARADEVFACDVAEAFVAQTRDRLVGHPAAVVDQADVRAYQPPPRIDLVYVGAVLMYLTDAEVADVLLRLRSAVTPDGCVILREWCTFNLGRPSTQAHSIHRSPSQVRALAREARFQCVTTASSPRIYAEAMGNVVTRWPLRGAWRLATLHWTRASHTFVLRPS